MCISFDLLTEPWIGVVRDAETTQTSLTDVLCSAHDISRISDPLPIVEFGLHRFLVALVMDICHFENYRSLEKLMDQKQFDPARIHEYFEKYGRCFDLFDSERPFLQTAGMDAHPEKPISGLLPCVPSGTAASHFHHYGESDFAVSPAVAARLLTSIAPFMTAGGAGLAPSINGAPPWYVLVHGETLFHTILLNCYTGSPDALGLVGDAHPAWRSADPPKCDGRSTKASLGEALTWRPRQIRLIPGGTGVCSISGTASSIVVRTMKFRPGASCDFTWTDPSVPYKITDKGPIVMRPQDGKEIWRDTGPLALLNNKAYESRQAKVQFARPRLIDQFEDLVVDRCIDPETPLVLTAYSMRTDMKMKVFEWQKEVLRVPAPLVVGGHFALFAQGCIEEAGRVENALQKSIKHLARDDGKGNPRALDNIVAGACRQYWSSLRTHYSDMLERLAALPAHEHAEAKFELQEAWKQSERSAAMRVFNEASRGLDAYGNNIQRQAEAERNLRMALRRIFETPEQKDSREKKSKARANSTKGGDEQ